MRYVMAWLLIWPACVVAQDSSSLHGRVVDAGGKPIAGAKVWAVLPGSIIASFDTKPMSEAMTNAEGQFTVLFSGDWRNTSANNQGHSGIVAYHPNYTVQALAIHRDTSYPEGPITLTLRPIESSSLIVWNSDLKPVSNVTANMESITAEVLANVPPTASLELKNTFSKQPAHAAFAGARWESNHFLALPAELRKKFTATSDAAGKFTWSGLNQQQMHYLSIHLLDGLDIKVVKSPYKLSGAWPNGVLLPALVKLEGTVKAPKPEMLTGLQMPFYSMNVRTKVLKMEKDKLTPVPNNDVTTQAQASAGVDQAGHYSVMLTEGHPRMHSSDIHRDGHLLLASAQGGSSMLTAGKPGKFDLEFKPTVQVEGVIQDQAGKPLPGIKLITGLRYIQSTAQLTTDANGRFRCQAVPGECQFYGATGEAVPYLNARDLFQFKTTIPVDVKTYTMPVMKLPTWTTVEGQLLGEDRKPRQGNVTVRWLAPAAQLMQLKFQNIATDAQGRFQIKHLDPRHPITVKASAGELATEAPVTVASGELSKPLEVVVKPVRRTAGNGVVRSNDKPLADATIKLWWKPPPSALHYEPPPRLNAPAVGQPIPIEDMQMRTGTLPVLPVELPGVIKTDAQGEYQLPAILDADGSYQVEASKPGYISMKSTWVNVTNPGMMPLPPLELAQRRLLAGQVVDNTGKPVSKVELIYHDATGKVRLRTDAAGNFKTDQAVSNEGYLIAIAPGYRTNGAFIKNSSQPMRLTLTSLSEKPTVPMPTLAPVLPLVERKKLFQELFAPVIARAKKEKNDNAKYAPFTRLVQQDPAQALEAITNHPFTTGWMQDYLKANIAKKLARESLEEARTIADSITEANTRSGAYLDFAQQLPADKLALKKDLLAQSLIHARAEPDPSHRLLYTAKVATQLQAIGETEQATRILREAQVAAEQLPTSGWGAYARGSFAEDLSNLDLTAAEKLCDAIEDAREKTRHLGNLAHLQAGKQPDQAERLLLKGAPPENNEFEYGRYAMRLCYRMAPVDLPRAIAIAERMKTMHHQKAEAFAQMARVLAATQPKEAEQLLRRAFAVLKEHARDAESDFTNIVDSATVAASFLPVAEMIDPCLVPEFFWETLAMRPDAVQAASVPFAKNKPAQGDCTLVLFLARYHHDVCKLLLDQHAELMMQSTDVDPVQFFVGTALVSPDLLAARIKPLQARGRADHCLDTALGMLLLDGEPLWKEVHRRLFMWYPDTVDH
ncbi:MAG: hypothetical protein QM703_11665 [Gemmatales bacterium]